MSDSRLPPRYPPDAPQDVTQENYEASEEVMNDGFYNQLYYMQTSTAMPSQTFHSTTYGATDPIDCTTDIYDIGTLHGSSTAYSEASASSSSRAFHSGSWGLQDVSNQFATLAMTSYETLQQTQQAYLHPPYASREETTIPEGGVFAIDIPVHSSPVDTNMHMPLPFGSELAEPSLNMQQEVQLGQTEPMGGTTLVSSAVHYDDDEIPRNDPSWLLRPQKHPWVQSGRAYLCRFDTCQITIVQRKNKRRHNAISHGLQ